MACRQYFHDLRIHFGYHGPRHHKPKTSFCMVLRQTFMVNMGDCIMFTFTAYSALITLLQVKVMQITDKVAS